MRIGLDARKIGPTGIGRYLNELLVEAVKLDPTIEWHLWVGSDYKQQVDPMLRQRHQILYHLTDVAYYSWQEQFRWASELDKYQLDLIHFPNFNLPTRLKTPAVATIHDLTLLQFPGRHMFPGKRWLYRRVLWRTLAQSKLIITDSRDSAKDIKAVVKERRLKTKLAIVPLGVSQFFQVPVRERELKAEMTLFGLVNPYYLIVASDLKHKNVIGMLQAFKQLVKEMPNCPHQVVLVGRYGLAGPVEQWLKQNHSIRQRILIAGVVSNVALRALYHQATALLFCSYKEGFGLPILEAFACGCPVITSNCSSMKEIAGAGALLVNPDDITAMSQAMLKIQQSSVSRKLLVLGKKIANPYSWNKSAKQIIKLYYEAVK